MDNAIAGAFSPDDINQAKSLVPLSENFEQYRHLLQIPMDSKRNVPRMDRAYFTIPADFEGGDDIDTGVGSPVKVALVKLLQAQSKEVIADEPHEGAKLGALWHCEHLMAIPPGTKVVPLCAYSIDFSDVPSKFDRKNDGPTWSMVFTTLEFLETYTNWFSRIANPMEYSLGNELLSNIFEIYFSGGAQKFVTDIQSDTLAGAGCNGRAYALSSKSRESTDGKFKWRELVKEPSRLLTPEEQFVSRSLTALVKEVIKINEQFYEYRKAQFENSGANDSRAAAPVNTTPAYDESADVAPPIADGGM